MIDPVSTGPAPRMRAPKLVLPKPASGRQLIANLDILIANPAKRPNPARFVSAFRSNESFVLDEAELEQILQLLNVLDPSWLAHLQVVAKALPRRHSAAASQLRTELITRARRASGFPIDAGDPGDVAASVLAWIRRVALAGPEQRPTAMLVVALQGVRRDPYYAEAMLVCLEARASSSRKVFTVDSFEGAVTELVVVPGVAGEKRARATLVVAAHVERERARLALELDGAAAAQDRLRRRVATLEERSGELETDLATLRAEIVELHAAAERSQLDAANTAREGQTVAVNAAAKVRSSTLSVLELETAQLRDYLNRPTPNAEDALESVRHLEELRDRLAGE